VPDDNKLLTLPNGERLNLPPNVRIMFEVEHLRYATLAAVSRCGMIWFGEDVTEPSMVYRHYLNTLSTVLLDADDEDTVDIPGRRTDLRIILRRSGCKGKKICFIMDESNVQVDSGFLERMNTLLANPKFLVFLKEMNTQRS
jgi:hypothetical protein